MTQILNLSRTTYEQINYVKGDTMLFYIQWKNSAGVNTDENTGFTWAFDFTLGNKTIFSLTPIFINNTLMKFAPTAIQVKKLAAADYVIRGVCTDTNGVVITKATIILHVFKPYQGANPIDDNDTLTLIDVTAPTATTKLATPAITLTQFTPDSISGQSTQPANATNWIFERSVHDANTWVEIDSTGNEFTDDGLIESTQYDYRVKVTANGYLDSDYSAVVSGSTTNSSGLSPQQDLFDFIITAEGALKWDTVNKVVLNEPAQPGDSVGQLTTLKGNWGPSVYNGEYNTLMDGKGPVLGISNGKSYLIVDNQPATFFDANGGPGQGGGIDPIPVPREVVRVFIKLPGTENEERSGGGNNKDLVGDGNGEVRIVRADGILDGVPQPLPYIVHIERIVAKADNTVDYWLDGVYKKSLALEGGDIDNYTKTENTVGVVSNNSDQGWAYEYHKPGILTDQEFADVYANFVQIHGAPVKIPEILLNNINYTNISGVLTPTFDIDNQLAGGRVMADPSLWDYQWINDDNSLQVQKLFHTGRIANVNQMDQGFGTQVKVRVMPKDTNNVGFCYYESKYKDVNA